MALTSQDRALITGANLVSDAKSDLDGRFSTVRAQVASAAAAWAGGGSQAFQQAMTSWDTSVRKVNEALTEFETSLRRTQSDFDETDAAQSDQFHKLNVANLG